MNLNSVVGYLGGTGRNLIPALAVPNATEVVALVGTDTGTTTAVLSLPQGTSINGSSNGLGPNVNPAILVPTGGLPGVTSDFNSSSFDGHAFKVRVAGRATVAAVTSQTLSIGIRLGTTVAGSVVVNPAQAGVVAAGGTFNFVAEATVIWDSVSHTVNGLSTSNVAGTAATTAAFTTITGIAAPANLTFVATAKLGLPGTATVNFTEFAIELV